MSDGQRISTDSSSIPSSNHKAQVRTRQVKTCIFFVKGNCRYGDSCKFAHTNLKKTDVTSGHGAPEGPSRNQRQQRQKPTTAPSHAGAGSPLVKVVTAASIVPLFAPSNHISEPPHLNSGDGHVALQGSSSHGEFHNNGVANGPNVVVHTINHEPNTTGKVASTCTQILQPQGEGSIQATAVGPIVAERERKKREQKEKQLAGRAKARQERKTREVERRGKERRETERQTRLAHEERERQERERQEIERREQETQERERQERERQAQEQRAKEEQERQELQRQARLARKEAAHQREIQKEAERSRQQEARRAEIARAEAAYTSQHIVLGSSLITCGAGVDILRVIGGFESCRLTVQNIPLDAKIDEVVTLFTQQGMDPKEFLILGLKRNKTGKHLEAQILTSGEQGQAIAIGLDGINFRDEVLSFEVAENSAADAMGSATAHNSATLRISWKAPSSSMIATYSTMQEARSKARLLDRTVFRGRRIRAEINQPPPSTSPAFRYFNPFSVKITGLPPHIAQSEVMQMAGSTSIKIIKSCLYDLEEAHQVLQCHLRAIPDNEMKAFEITSQGGVEGYVTVQVRFDSWEHAKVARDSVGGKRLRDDYPLFNLSLPDPLRFVSTIPVQQYRAQKQLWDSLADHRNNRAARLDIHIYDGERVAIRVLGDDKKAMGALKVRVETLTSGERLDATCWHRSFNSFMGRQFLAKVSSDTGVFVRADWKVHALRMYGCGDAKEEARRLILAEVDRLALLEWTISLKRQSVGYLVRKGLATLKELLGEDCVTLDLASIPCKLTIRGGEEARHVLDRVLDQSLENLDLDHPGTEANDICPICYDGVSHPVKLGCGHVYCTACIRHYLTSAPDTKKFPLSCIGDEARCRTLIPIPLIQRFLPPQQFSRLVDVAFSTYLDLHPQEFRYCTTPDCNQIYRCNSKVAQKCPSCFATICSTCHEESHEGMTCAERKIHKDPEEQERLNSAWASANGVKKCPSCQIWIEKIEGCNHMTCRCGAHVCWRCMGVFTGATIYQHLEDVHGGAFEVERDDGGALQRQREAEEQWERIQALRLQVRPAVVAAPGVRVAYQAAQPAAEGWEDEQRVREARIRVQRLEAARELEARQEQARRALEARVRAQHLEAIRREQYQRELDARQERLRQEAQRRRDKAWGCIVM